MRIVVTGASGNVGSALLRGVAGPGPIREVVAVARRVPPAPLGGDRRIRWVSCDIADPSAATALAAAMAGTDAVVNLAWQLQPSHDRERLRRTNVAGLAAVVAAARSARVPHLVHSSSVGVYAPGPKDRAVAEDWPATGIPTSRYSEDKVAAERLLDDVEAEGGLAVTRIRPALIMQRGAASEIARYFAPAFARPVLRVPLPVVPLPDRTVTQFVHADDVVAAIEAILVRQATGAFNLTAEPPLGPDDLASALGGVRVPLPEAALREAAALTWRLRVQPVDSGWVDLLLHSPLLSAARAERELDWRPRHSTGEALDELVGGLRDGAGGPGPLLRPIRVFR